MPELYSSSPSLHTPLPITSAEGEAAVYHHVLGSDSEPCLEGWVGTAPTLHLPDPVAITRPGQEPSSATQRLDKVQNAQRQPSRGQETFQSLSEKQRAHISWKRKGETLISLDLIPRNRGSHRKNCLWAWTSKKKKATKSYQLPSITKCATNHVFCGVAGSAELGKAGNIASVELGFWSHHVLADVTQKTWDWWNFCKTEKQLASKPASEELCVFVFN